MGLIMTSVDKSGGRISLPYLSILLGNPAPLLAAGEPQLLLLSRTGRHTRSTSRINLPPPVRLFTIGEQKHMSDGTVTRSYYIWASQDFHAMKDHPRHFTRAKE